MFTFYKYIGLLFGYAFEEERLPNPLLLPLHSYEPMQWRFQRWKVGDTIKVGGGQN